MENSIILIRTSTNDQHPELQIEENKKFNETKGWNLVKIFEKKESAFKNEEGVWKEEVEWAIKNNIKHIIVWNMDRYSRLPEDRVLREVKILSLIHGINLHAVHGDLWSEIVESVGKLKEMGFIGEAISEFLEKLLKGIEFQRANRESQTKSERVKLAVRKNNGKPTMSYKGNKWGRKHISTQKRNNILELSKVTPKLSLRAISQQSGVSLAVVWKVLQDNQKVAPADNFSEESAEASDLSEKSSRPEQLLIDNQDKKYEDPHTFNKYDDNPFGDLK